MSPYLRAADGFQVGITLMIDMVGLKPQGSQSAERMLVTHVSRRRLDEW